MLKPSLSISLIILCFQFSLLGQYSNADNYINQYKSLAISEMSRTGIPASIKMGQAILESAAGTSTLATKAYNHFGVKCGSVWQGDNYGLKDDERMLLFFKKKSCFRKYNNPEESYMDHSAFLTRPNSPYKDLFTLDKTDYKAWAYGLKKAGYATADDYPEKLIGIIERYHLYQLDGLTNNDVVNNYKPVKTPDQAVVKPIEPKDRIIRINQVKAIVAKAGETPLLIGRSTNTDVSDILEYNDRIEYSTQVLNDNEIVFLQKKKKTYWGKNKTHTVIEGENMFSLSQQYGVTMDMLYERNRMNKSTEPAVGQIIYLRGDRPDNDQIKVVPKNQAPKKEANYSEPIVSETHSAKKILVSKSEPAVSKEISSYKESDKIDEIQKEKITNPSLSSKAQTTIIKPVNQNVNSENLDFSMEPMGETDEPEPEIKEEPRFKPALTGAGFPTVSSSPVKEINEEKPVSNPNISEFHTVTAGDTLYNISKRYELSVATLKDLNSLTDNNIKLGQKLKLK